MSAVLERGMQVSDFLDDARTCQRAVAELAARIDAQCEWSQHAAAAPREPVFASGTFCATEGADAAPASRGHHGCNDVFQVPCQCLGVVFHCGQLSILLSQAQHAYAARGCFAATRSPACAPPPRCRCRMHRHPQQGRVS